MYNKLHQCDRCVQQRCVPPFNVWIDQVSYHIEWHDCEHWYMARYPDMMTIAELGLDWGQTIVEEQG